jgi:hypothetical protein
LVGLCTDRLWECTPPLGLVYPRLNVSYEMIKLGGILPSQVFRWINCEVL